MPRAPTIERTCTPRAFRRALQHLLCTLGIVAAASLSAAGQTVSLPAYTVDAAQISVSGLSSGGFMAVQFEVAYSASLKGAGVIAGGPYYCAQGDPNTAESVCSCALPCSASADTKVQQLIGITDRNAGSGAIDSTTNLAQHRVWLFSGANDSVVPQRVMNDLLTYYKHYMDASNISYKHDLAAEHAMPTDFFGNSCATKGDPYINNCDFDAAGELLQWIYGPLSPKNTGQLGGTFVQFDQSEFLSNPTSHEMDTIGWAYVPSRCANGQTCKLHVVFHGCQQYQGHQYFSPGSGLVTFGTTYVRNTGYNKWADTNDIIILYPQATASADFKTNPNGCWDWWGYDDPNYATKGGRQMAAVKAMIDRIVGPPGLPAPATFAVTGSTDGAISVSWSPVANAAGFNVYRNAARANGDAITGTSFTDTGLTSCTNYTYVVKAVDSANKEGAASGPVQGETTGACPLQPPANLKAEAVDAASIGLTWTSPSGVDGFDVLRSTQAGGPYTKVNGSLILDPSFTDKGLAAKTTYFYVVKSEDSSGVQSAPSAEVSATTASPSCFSATNSAHVIAGRAHDEAFLAFANGSNQFMGPDNVFVTTHLKQTNPGSYVLVNMCP